MVLLHDMFRHNTTFNVDISRTHDLVHDFSMHDPVLISCAVRGLSPRHMQKMSCVIRGEYHSE